MKDPLYGGMFQAGVAGTAGVCGQAFAHICAAHVMLGQSFVADIAGYWPWLYYVRKVFRLTSARRFARIWELAALNTGLVAIIGLALAVRQTTLPILMLTVFMPLFLGMLCRAVRFDLSALMRSARGQIRTPCGCRYKGSMRRRQRKAPMR